jgi:hypothetical protein
MPWEVEFHSALADEFESLDEAVQDELLAHAKLLQNFGPTLGRPKVDTLKGSKIINLKELRFNAGRGVWRVAFAFDKGRIAVLLAAGDKRGENEDRFYKRLIATAERRFVDWCTLR